MTSANTYPQEMPATCLMIKQHRITKLLYLCKTTRKNIDKYKGSGIKWRAHIKKHGKDHVENIWYCWFYEKEVLVEFALLLSKLYNIVDSEEWANLIVEMGIGIPQSELNISKNSEAKQNRAWFNDGTVEMWLDSSQVNSHLVPGRISKHSTVTQEQIDRSVKTFGFDQEENFKEELSRLAITGNYYMSHFSAIFPKTEESRFRDPSVRFFLKKYDLVQYLKRDKRNRSVSNPVH